MRLDYNILWIDNDIPDYEANGEVGNVESFLKELGFEPNIVTIEDEADLDDFIDLHKYDLIISDFNLNDTTGDVIIEKIRVEKGYSTEILFYTAKGSYRNDPDVKERLAFMDRITFHVGRDTFLDKVENLIRLTLDKLLELNATRGLITSATSDLDVEIENIVMQLVQYHKIEESNLNNFIVTKVLNPLQKRLDTFWKKYDGFQNYFHRIDAVKKWEIFRDLLKLMKTDQAIVDFLKVNKTYQVEVIDIRNKFAHSKAEEIDGRLVLKGQMGKDDFEFDEEACIQIRRNLINHKNAIEDLKELLNNLP